MDDNRSPFEIWDFAGWARRKRDRYLAMSKEPTAEPRDAERAQTWAGILARIEDDDPAGAYGHALLEFGEGAASTRLLRVAARGEYEPGNWHEVNGVDFGGIHIEPRKAPHDGEPQFLMADEARQGVLFLLPNDIPSLAAVRAAKLAVVANPDTGDVQIIKSRRGPTVESVLQLRRDLIDAEVKANLLRDEIHDLKAGATYVSGAMALGVVLPEKAARGAALRDLAKALGCQMGTFTLADLTERAKALSSATASIAIHKIHAMLHGDPEPSDPMPYDAGEAVDETVRRVALLLAGLDAAASALALARQGRASANARPIGVTTRYEQAESARGRKALVALQNILTLARDPEAAFDDAPLDSSIDPADVVAEVFAAMRDDQINSSDVAEEGIRPEQVRSWARDVLPGYKPKHREGDSYLGMALTINEVAGRLGVKPMDVLGAVAATKAEVADAHAVENGMFYDAVRMLCRDFCIEGDPSKMTAVDAALVAAERYRKARAKAEDIIRAWVDHGEPMQASDGAIVFDPAWLSE